MNSISFSVLFPYARRPKNAPLFCDLKYKVLTELPLMNKMHIVIFQNRISPKRCVEAAGEKDMPHALEIPSVTQPAL